MQDVTFKTTITLEHVSGPAQDAETLLDSFAGTYGRDNGSKTPLTVTWTEWPDDAENPIESVYVVKLVD